jgi:hypothetical protein
VSGEPPVQTYEARYIVDDDFADAQREWLRDICRRAAAVSGLNPREVKLVAAISRVSEWVDGPPLSHVERRTARRLDAKVRYLDWDEETWDEADYWSSIESDLWSSILAHPERCSTAPSKSGEP